MDFRKAFLKDIRVPVSSQKGIVCGKNRKPDGDQGLGLRACIGAQVHQGPKTPGWERNQGERSPESPLLYLIRTIAGHSL